MRHSVPCQRAVAQIRGGEGSPAIRGTVSFTPGNRCVRIRAELWGLPENETGFFALHIHEGGSCGGEGFSETLGHFNPGNQLHPLHAGDLPPLLSCHGRALLVVDTDRFAISEVIGRTVVIHGGADDFHTQSAGNAGTKIACGIVKKL